MNPGVHVAIHAGIEEERRKAEEEEKMTKYTNEELDNNWEFKIVRSSLGAFRKPAVLENLIEEEAQAGWVMVEKFDNNRIRFKRPSNAQKRDAMLPDYVDPYQTQYGGNLDQNVRLMILGLAVLLAGVIVFFIMN